MFLSIITINLNNADGLQKTMDSVFAQTDRDFEYIVIDGGSSDNSHAIITAQETKLAWWCSEKDNGRYDAMNRGVKKAKGKYVMLLNSGDCFCNDHILADMIKCKPFEEVDIYYGNIRSWKNGTYDRVAYPSPLSLSFWESATINHQASFISRALFDDLGWYDNKYALAGDYAFFLRCFVSGKTFSHLNMECVDYMPDGISERQRSDYEREMKLAWKNIVPEYAQSLHHENKAFHLLMKHRLMRWAEKLNGHLKKIRSA